MESSKETWKITGGNTGNKHSETTKANISLNMSNQIWINNGQRNTRINKTLNIPEGFVRGRMSRTIPSGASRS